MMAATKSNDQSRSRHAALSLPAHARLKRTVARLPEPQKKILDKSTAWIGNRQDNSATFLNLPNEILEQLESFHAEKEKRVKENRTANTQTTTSLQPDQLFEGSGSKVKHEEEESDKASARGETPPAPSKHGDDADSTASSWNPTPKQVIAEREAYRRAPLGESTPSSKHTKNNASVAPHIGQNYDCIELEGSSESESEEEMAEETRAMLQAQAHAVQPLAQAVATPPSAQIVPCTFHQRSSPPGQPMARKRRKMKTLDMSAPIFASKKSPDRLAQLRLISHTRVTDITSSNTTSTPSVGVGASQEQDVQDHSVIPATSQNGEPPATDIRATSSPSTRSRGRFEQDEATSPAHSSAASQVITLQPFESFQLAYPAYNGSLNDFVRACFYVRELQEWQALPSFLYDDFIRAFTAGYIPYVNDPQSSSRDADSPPLTGIKWYNANVEAPVFNERLLVKSNIDLVLDAYRDEVEELRARMNLAVQEAADESDAKPLSEKSEELGSCTGLNNPDDEMEVLQSTVESGTEEARSETGKEVHTDLGPINDLDDDMEDGPGVKPVLEAHTEQDDGRDPLPAAEQEVEEMPDRENDQIQHIKRKHDKGSPRHPTSPRAPNSSMLQSTSRASRSSSAVPGSSRYAASPKGAAVSHQSPAQRSRRFKKFLAKRISESVPSSARSSFGNN